MVFRRFLLLFVIMFIWSGGFFTLNAQAKSSHKKSQSVKRTVKKSSHSVKKQPKSTKKALEKSTKKAIVKRPVPTFEAVTVGQRAPEDPFLSPRSISVIDRKTLEEHRPRTVPEALMETAGVFVQKTNHGGGAPIIRGAVGPQVLILIDGVRLNTSTFRSGPNQYLNLIDIWSTRRLEVLRGSSSLAYGSYAFGGVLNIRTRSPIMQEENQFFATGRLIGRYGSADQERTGRLAVSGSMSGIALLVGVTFGDFGDLRPGQPQYGKFIKTIPIEKRSIYYHKNIYGDLLLDPATGGQPFSAYQNLYVDSKLIVRLGNRWKLTALYQHAQLSDAGRADQLVAKGSMRYYTNKRDFGYIRLKGRLPSLHTHLRFTVAGQWFREFVARKRFYNKKDFAPKKESENNDKVGVIGFLFDGDTRVNSWLDLVYGGDFYFDTIFSEARSRKEGGDFKESTPTYPKDTTYTTLGGYLVGRFLLTKWDEDNKIYLRVGDRVNGFLANAPKRKSLDAVQFQQFGNALYASLQLLLQRQFNVSLSYSEGFRAPNLQEAVSLGDAGNDFEIPNKDLKPEISRTLELTVRGNWNHFSAWMTGYASFWNDLITTKTTTFEGQSKIDGKPVVMRVNQKLARVVGIESGLAWRFWEHLTFLGNLTWTSGRAIEDDGSETPLSRIPPLFGKVALHYTLGKSGFVELFALMADAQTEISARDKRDPRIPSRDEQNPDSKFDGTPGWWTLNIRGGWNFNQRLNMQFSVENLFNQLYKYHGSGVFAPGLSARLMLEWKI